MHYSFHSVSTTNHQVLIALSVVSISENRHGLVFNLVFVTLVFDSFLNLQWVLMSFVLMCCLLFMSF